MRSLAAALVLLVTASTATAGTSQPYALGGWYERFGRVIDQYNGTGELMRIQGHCQSLCTMFLGLRNVCVERSARLLFHAGHDRQRRISQFSTQRMMGAYNSRLRGYLEAGGYMQTPAFHTVSGADMIQKFGYRECPRR
jgi:hypothetical protein